MVRKPTTGKKHLFQVINELYFNIQKTLDMKLFNITLVRCLTKDPKVMSSNVINKTHSELTYGSHRECLPYFRSSSVSFSTISVHQLVYRLEQK